MPRALDWMDWALGIMADIPLAPLEKLSTILLLSGYARNEVALARGIDQGRRSPGAPELADEDLAYVDGLRALVDPAGLPALHAVVTEGLFTGPPLRRHGRRRRLHARLRTAPHPRRRGGTHLDPY